jgi:superfamily II DNA or RNA helicase
MENEFGILIDDGSKHIQPFVIDENTKSLELYDWQRRAINYFFKNDCNSIFEVTTGAGKTYCAIQIVKRIWELDPKVKVLIIVPKNVIMETGWYSELYEAGVSLVDIGVYYGNIKEYSKVTITNMQNLDRIAFEIFDCIIFDEIHNYGTERLLPYVSMKMKYKLGLSATLERMDNSHYKLLEIFNYNKFTYTPRDALDDGVLNPFNFFNISVELDGAERENYELLTEQINSIMQAGGGYKKIMRSNSGLKFKLLSKMTARKDLVNNYYKKFDVVKQIVNKHRNDKIIIFNEFNKQTSKSYWYLLDIGVRACVIHSDLPKEKREQNLMDFKNDKYNVILASKVLDEGYNLPKIDTAIIAAGNSTSRQTIQRMGRVLRRKKHTSNLYQVYCKDTIEENYAFERALLFKDLCSDYDSYHYEDGDLEL